MLQILGIAVLVGLYWAAAVLYLMQTTRLIRAEAKVA